MRMNLEKLWELADEKLQQHETEAEDNEEDERYHEGWTDAMRWLIETLEPAIYNQDEDADDEW